MENQAVKLMNRLFFSPTKPTTLLIAKEGDNAAEGRQVGGFTGTVSEDHVVLDRNL